MKKQFLLVCVLLCCSLQAAAGYHELSTEAVSHGRVFDFQGVLHKATPKEILKQLTAVICWQNADYSIREFGVLGKVPRNAVEWKQYARTATHRSFDLLERVNTALSAVYTSPKKLHDAMSVEEAPVVQLQTLPRQFLDEILRVSWKDKSKYFSQVTIEKYWNQLPSVRRSAIQNLLNVLGELTAAEESVVQKQDFENTALALSLQKEDAAVTQSYQQREEATAAYYEQDEQLRWARAERGVLDTSPFEAGDQELKIPKVAMWYLAKRGKDKSFPMFRKVSRFEHAWRKMSDEEKRTLIYANDIIADYLKAKRDGFPDRDASVHTPIPSYAEIHGTSKKARKAIWLLLGRSRFKFVPSGRKGPGELVRLWNRMSSGEQKAVEPLIRLLIKLDKDMKFKKMQVHNKAWVAKGMAKGLFYLVAGAFLLTVTLLVAVIIIAAANSLDNDGDGVGNNLFFWLWLFDRNHNSAPLYVGGGEGAYKTKVSPVWKRGDIRVVGDHVIHAQKWKGYI